MSDSTKRSSSHKCLEPKGDCTKNYVDAHLGSGMAKKAAEKLRGRKGRIDAAIYGQSK